MERGIKNSGEGFSNKIAHFLISVILFTGAGNCLSQTASNLEIFDKEISGELDRILYSPDLRRDVQFIFSVSSSASRDDEVKFLNSVIKKSAERNKIRISLTKGNIESQDSVYNSVYFDIAEIRTTYPGFAKNPFLGTKVVHRNLDAVIKVSINGNNYNFSKADTISISYKDKVKLDKIDNLETEDYRFTHAAAPKVSVYEEIIFPAAVITASVAAAVLFFIIRSK